MSVTENKKGLPDSYKLNMKSQKKIPVKQLLKHNIPYIKSCTINLITKLLMKSKLKDPAKKYIIIVV